MGKRLPEPPENAAAADLDGSTATPARHMVIKFSVRVTDDLTARIAEAIWSADPVVR